MTLGMRWIAAAFTACALFAAGGCAHVKQVQPEQTAAAEGVKMVGQDLLDALLNNKAKEFMALLPASVRQDFTEKDFAKTRDSIIKELGEPLSYEFVMNLEHPVCTISIWKIRFERDSADKTKKIRQETMFRVVAGNVDDKLQILSFNFL